MSASPYDLPPVTLLRAFESAARRASFKDAAAELNVTPGAISHNVKALEADLGLRLFERGHRQVTLTADGQHLADTLSRGFADIDAMLRRLRRSRDSLRVDIAVTTAMSHLWLTPRLVAFWQDHADIQINQQLSDSPVRRPLITDLLIEYRNDPPTDARWTRLFSGDLTPIAAPGTPPPADLTALAAMPLIQMDTENKSWTGWAEWFGLGGYDGPITVARRVNSHSIAVQLAQQGGGVALGWRRLVADRIAAGQIAAFDAYSQPAPGAFYLIAAAQTLSPAAEAFFDWLATHTN